MRALTPDASHSHNTTFSLVQGGPPYRIQQRLGLIPRRGLGVPRRMLFFILLTWAPIMAWAIVSRRLFAGIATEPLLQHFSVHVRCLVAIPLFIAAEAVVESISQRIFPYFVTSGIVPRALESRFVEILRQAGRLRDSWLAGAVLAALALLLAWHFTGVSKALHGDELSWAVRSDTGHPQLGFGGWWFLFVVRPVFAFSCCIGSGGCSSSWSAPGISHTSICIWFLPIPTVLAVLDSWSSRHLPSVRSS